MATAARSRKSVHGGTQSPSATDVSPFAPAPTELRVCGFTLRPRLLLLACGVLVLHTSVTVIEEEMFAFPGFRYGVRQPTLLCRPLDSATLSLFRRVLTPPGALYNRCSCHVSRMHL